ACASGASAACSAESPKSASESKSCSNEKRVCDTDAIHRDRPRNARAMKEPAREHNTTPGSLPKAVAVGVFIDFAGSLLVAFTLSLIYTLVLTARGYSQDEIQRTFSALGPWSALGIVIMLLSLIVSAYAGYQCARVANRTTYLAPGIVAMISCA